MANDAELSMKSFNQIRLDHPYYIVPAYLETPVCETKSMYLLRQDLRLRRKSIERVRVVQNPGSIFHFSGTKNRILACVVLAVSPETLTYESLRKYVAKAVLRTVEDAAVIGDGFQMSSKTKNRDDVHHGFELLCRVLRRLGYTGTLYEPPEYLERPDPLAGFADEQITDTHTILRWDGSVSPSLPPAMLKLLKSKSD